MTDDRHDHDVAQALGRLRTAEQPDADPREVVYRRLGELLPEAADALVRAAEQLLAEGHPPAEGRLLVVLTALTTADHPAAPALLVRAIESPFTQLKEDYLSLLEELDEVEAGIEALLAVLRDGRVKARPDLAVTIRAMHVARRPEAVDLVAELVGAPERAVRGLAVDYLYEFDEDGTAGAPAVLDRLETESDPEIVDQIIGALERWDRVEAVPQLERFAADESRPSELRQLAGQVAGRLGDTD